MSRRAGDATGAASRRAESVTGAAAPIVLVHGVGFGPETLAPLARALDDHAPVISVARRGYGRRARESPAKTVAEHVDDIACALDNAGAGRAVVAGMSGGATVALAFVLSHPERVVAAVAHEPAVGSVAPELRALVLGALGEGGGSKLLRVLAGAETWRKLPAEIVLALDANARLVEADAAAFLAFEPPLPSRPVRLPLVCSVGERSSALRFTVARRLAARTGAPVAVVPGCGHLPQLDAPDAFARLILDQLLVTPGDWSET
jgi:3-oxoadipate enol-lactonase/3-oxoadipate enol-lactonase/4-carboxymuconolactone decarboxylase